MSFNSELAFPHDTGPYTKPGMTKRELVAMELMASWRTVLPGMASRELAENAVKDADALLEELARK